ncbi:GvpL/GvpF family gas vesicle protein [Streptomyces sp. AM8-1-1]|uniref:GvpL/GvpF family gas vesicle protein n=1 Tax=Streptomyces sp. AM8-1-1 TaxID=3075825 RepID=UPI0028C40324|nr:GvpL/GvpF family gas vesicle protein [Streptomyces sp. AM8-1-1]WNO76534.1 GvpL/GvpF family gas vesicle protein [Streptomyces sp. AM8-1-1]
MSDLSGPGTTAAPRLRADGPAAETGQATYVFAVCRPAAGDVPAARGHAEGGPLRTLLLGRLALLVQSVPADAFSEDELRRRLGDRAELERCAREHHAAVEAARASGPVIPFPLATLYRSDRRAIEALRAGEPRFSALLDRLTGHVEWAVKVHLARPAAEPEAAEPTARPTSTRQGASGQGAGRAYLSRVSGRQRQADEERQAAFRAAEQVDEAVRRHATAAVRHRLHSAELTGSNKAQVLNAAYLIGDEAYPAFARTVADLRGTPALSGIEIDVTGPWAPYSFAELGDYAPGQPGAGAKEPAERAGAPRSEGNAR